MWQGCQNCTLRVHRKVLSRKLFLKNFHFSHHFRILSVLFQGKFLNCRHSIRKISPSGKKTEQVCQNRIVRDLGNNLGRNNFFSENCNFLSFLAIELLFCGRRCQNCNLCVHMNTLVRIFFWKIFNFFYLFRTPGEKFLAFWETFTTGLQNLYSAFSDEHLRVLKKLVKKFWKSSLFYTFAPSSEKFWLPGQVFFSQEFPKIRCTWSYEPFE